MSEIAIKVENLSKSYRIRKGEAARYTALRDVMAERAAQFFNHLKKGQNPFSQSGQHEIFWALDDVSFEVKQGEVMGVIGRNGAGKSTLLKILSRITEPDKGRITLNGRVASLLEVGTGFHPELTGRENIYLSGAILGMRREEIKKRFDEIVDFAGVEKFLDTPVKRYSSGMYVRLGFAVAAHLETEILLVDEVLAVGDAEFQQKCIGKMHDVGKHGKSILLVSHNMGSIRRLCQKSFLMDNGSIALFSNTEDCITEYVSCNRYSKTDLSLIKKNRSGSGIVRLSEVFFQDSNTGKRLNELISGQAVDLIIKYKSKELAINLIRDLQIGVSIYDEEKGFVTVLNNRMSNYLFENVGSEGVLICSLGKISFMYGAYNCIFNLLINHVLSDRVEGVCRFKVMEGDYYESGFSNCHDRSGIYVNQKWQIL
ncbi:MAG: ABC transporter ATP-binding protein [Saprospiraceae bacterium]|nr:ABC transporter ATP-binding protein [Saprospiraceae bacterium]MCF8251421.1 ABC transporter ATP-binding protein [Saprospiraceae bacterium]MCF8312695.1 ABC transporter ATP-binding protein [Saprospiraceae bacterium]MCF8441039.1 ABC transporter ATP-binding protein [Saprospiraceae bacterium]